jgi:hypothetical protein
MAFSTFNSFHSTKSRIFKKITSTATLVNSYATPLTSTFTGFYKNVTGNTGNTAYQNGTYFITESSEYSTSFSAWKAFNGNVGNVYNYQSATGNYNTSGGSYTGSTSTSLVNSTSVSGEWIQILYPYSFVLNSYTLVLNGDGSSANSWVIVGSNDGSSWVTLDTKTLIAPQAGTSVLFTTSVTNTVSYNYYRFIITKLTGGFSYGGVVSLNLYVPTADIPLATYFTPTSAPFTSASLTIAGDTNTKKNGLYIVSSSSIYGSGFNAFNSFNGLITDIAWLSVSGSYINNAASASSGTAYSSGAFSTTISGTAYIGEWLQIQLPSAITLASYNLLGRLNPGDPGKTSPKIWYIAGSNDGSTWTMIDSQSVSSSFWTTYLNSKTAKNLTVSSGLSYSYYRIVVNAIFDSNSQFIYAGINQFNLIGN